MLVEIISFGGYVKERKLREGRKKPVRLKQESDEKTVLVQIKTKQRDNAKTVKDDKGKEVENPRYGKFYYQSVDSFELEQTTPHEVTEAVLRGITAATRK